MILNVVVMRLLGKGSDIAATDHRPSSPKGTILSDKSPPDSNIPLETKLPANQTGISSVISDG